MLAGIPTLAGRAGDMDDGVGSIECHVVRMTGMGLAWILAVAGSANCAEAPVHRCRGTDGSVQYQDRACAAGREDPAWDAGAFAARTIAPMDEAAVAARSRQAALERREQQRWETASRRRLAPSLGGSPSRAAGAVARNPATARRSAPAGKSCRRALETRADAYRRDWLRLGYEQRASLDAAVRSACDDADR